MLHLLVSIKISHLIHAFVIPLLPDGSMFHKSIHICSLLGFSILILVFNVAEKPYHRRVASERQAVFCFKIYELCIITMILADFLLC